MKNNSISMVTVKYVFSFQVYDDSLKSHFKWSMISRKDIDIE
jgi:hypothetical protein